MAFHYNKLIIWFYVNFLRNANAGLHIAVNRDQGR